MITCCGVFCGDATRTGDAAPFCIASFALCLGCEGGGGIGGVCEAAGATGALERVGETAGFKGGCDLTAEATGDLAGCCAGSLVGVAAMAGLEGAPDLGVAAAVDLTEEGATRGEADPFHERFNACGEERGEEGARREDAERGEEEADCPWKKFLRLAMEGETGDPDRPPSRSRFFFSSSS